MRNLAVCFLSLLACTPQGGEETDGGQDAGTEVPRLTFEVARDAGLTGVTEVVYAEPFSVLASGLTPGTRVTLEATLWGYVSDNTFVVPPDGRVDLARDAPVEGSYTGVDPDGFLWSMSKFEDLPQNNYDITIMVLQGGSVLTQATLVRKPMGWDATRVEVRDQGLYGTLLVPPGPPRPVVVVVGGSEGGLEGALFNAAHVESMGYAALALAYFGAPGLPQQLLEIPLEYFGTAFQWLRNRTDVDAEHLAFLGSSRGGELALLVGSSFPDDVDAVVAHVGSGILMASVTDGTRAAWTLGGAPLPFIPLPDDLLPQQEALPGGGVGYRLAPATETAIRAMDAGAVETSTIHVESSAAPILLLAASDDGVWPSCFLSEVALSRLTAHGHTSTHMDALSCLPDAGHWFGVPGWPTGDTYFVSMGNYNLILGGSAEGNGRASRQYDSRIRAFLHQVFP